jgi:hypothetical protein
MFIYVNTCICIIFVYVNTCILYVYMYYICVHLLCDLDLLNGTIICSSFVIVLSLDNHLLCLINRNRQEEFEDTNGEIRSRKSKEGHYNDQKKKDKQRSTKHYTGNKRSSYPTKKRM